MRLLRRYVVIERKYFNELIINNRVITSCGSMYFHIYGNVLDTNDAIANRFVYARYRKPHYAWKIAASMPLRLICFAFSHVTAYNDDGTYRFRIIMDENGKISVKK